MLAFVKIAYGQTYDFLLFSVQYVCACVCRCDAIQRSQMSTLWLSTATVLYPLLIWESDLHTSAHSAH